MDTEQLKIHASRIARSRAIGISIIALASISALFFAFEAGVSAGYHRATFSGHLNENYTRTFGGPGRLMGPDGPNPHGSSGGIVSVTLPTFTIAGSRGPEQTVRLGADTLVRSMDGTVASSSLSVGMSVIVIGEPNDAGEVEAKLIRIIPISVGSTTSTR